MKIVNLSGTTELVKQAIKLPGWYTIGVYDPLRRFLQDTYKVDPDLLVHEGMFKQNKFFKSTTNTVLKNLARKANNDSATFSMEQNALNIAQQIINCYDDSDAQSYPSYFWGKGLYWDNLWLKQDKGVFIIDDAIDNETLKTYNAKKLFIFKPLIQFNLRRHDELTIFTEEINLEELQNKLDSI
jgi:hypothetical protein